PETTTPNHNFGISGTNPAPTNAEVISFINSQNPSGSGTEILSGSNYVSCSLPRLPTPQLQLCSSPDPVGGGWLALTISTPEEPPIGILVGHCQRPQQTPHRQPPRRASRTRYWRGS